MSTLKKNTDNDVKLVDPPTDTVSCMNFSSQADFLAVSSWDYKVRIYEIAPNGQSMGRALYEHDAPVLTCAFSPDGTKVASGGGDNKAILFDINTKQKTTVGVHTSPISSMVWTNPNQQILVTGSWDKTVKYWDLRQPNPIGSIQVSDRVISMDSKHPLLAVALANQEIACINLENPFSIAKMTKNKLPYAQTNIAVFSHPVPGMLISTIEARCSIQHLDDKYMVDNKSGDFTFKAHRDGSKLYTVNQACFCPANNAICTMGSDGSFIFWDKEQRTRLTSFTLKNPGPVTCGAFNRTGLIFAYAVGYDWSKGYKHHTKTGPNYVALHAVHSSEMEKKKTTTSR